MLDPLLLRTFLTIAQGNSFSETSRKLAMRQSTVSDHVRRLEDSLGRQLFVRDTHSVALTPEGETLIGYARTILETGERAERHFAGTRLRGRVRFGASEDLVLSWLPSVLRGFVADHPEVDLEFSIALSSTLIARYDAGDLDIVLCKRWPGETRGEVVWRDEIVWVGADPQERQGQERQGHERQGHERQGHERQGDSPLPLILYPPPSITRSMALAALSQAEVPWRIACTSENLSGVVAAARAGLGIAVLARNLVPDSLARIPAQVGLPALGSLDFILLRHARAPRAPISELAAAIVAKSARNGAGTAQGSAMPST